MINRLLIDTKNSHVRTDAFSCQNLTNQITENMNNAQQSESESYCDNSPSHMSIIHRRVFTLGGVTECQYNFNLTIFQYFYGASLYLSVISALAQ